MTKKVRQIYQKSLLVGLLTLSLLLGACGTVSNNNNTRSTSTANSSITAAVQLSPTFVTVNNSPTIVQPNVTATAVIAPTPTGNSRSVIVPPTQAKQPVPATPTAVASPTAELTPTPTPESANQLVDRTLELKATKAAYDAINEHLFKNPDTAALLTASLKELSNMTGVIVPNVAFEKDATTNWNIFSQTFNKMLDTVRNFKFPKNQMAHRMIEAMAGAVGDEHTYFLDTTEYQSRQDLLAGDNSSVGFGILETSQDNKAYIVRVVPGAPADLAGVKAGDQVVQFDNTPITDKNWTIIRSALENETHKFILLRPDTAQPITLNITKKKYNLPTVEYRMINKHIGYIAVRDFFLNVADETDRAMTELRKQGADSWLIDLRQNPGGINVEQLVGRFVAGGEIMGYNSDRKNRDPMKVSNDLNSGPNKGKAFAPLLPMAVLIDDGSASSSEMFALAARDFKLGPLIGVKTAGALGHTAAYSLGDGSAISVTVDEYESRSGEKVNGVGVTPDTTVERSIQDLISGRDPQLTAGVGYLEKQLAKK